VGGAVRALILQLVAAVLWLRAQLADHWSAVDVRKLAPVLVGSHDRSSESMPET
jgi:hypothetical protein